jgi:hypothetical protein
MREHLLNRWFDSDRYSGVWIEEDVSATFAMWNFSGQMVGYQKYEPGAPRTHKNGSHSRYHSFFGENKVGVWGLESVDWQGGVLFLTEGAFNASRLHWHGFQAVAVISNDPKHLRSWLSTLPHHRVAVLDGDAAGRKLAKYGHESLQMPVGEDVNSLSDEQFQQFFAQWLEKSQ